MRKINNSRCRYLALLFMAVLLAFSALATPQATPQANSLHNDKHNTLPKLFSKGRPSELHLAQEISLNYLQNNLNEFGISNIDDLKVVNVNVDELSMAHTRLQQTYQGVRIFGGEAIVHLNGDGSIFNITDSLIKNVKVRTTARLTAEQALKIATDNFGCSDCLTSQPAIDLWILPTAKKQHLTYRVRLARIDGSNETKATAYFVDAHSSKIISAYSELQTGTGVGSGTSLYSGNQSFNTYYSSAIQPFGNYYLHDLTRKLGIFTANNTSKDTNNLMIYNFTDVHDNIWDGTTQQAAVDVHYATAKYYDYLKNTLNRNWLDGAGGPRVATAADNVTNIFPSVIHYGVNYNNAFYDPNNNKIYYGDGDGTSNFKPLVSIDTVGHELTHGLTKFAVPNGGAQGLIYNKESGAINESWSDVFGYLLERRLRPNNWNWLIGEEIVAPGYSFPALRSMSNPTMMNQPQHYKNLFVPSTSLFDPPQTMAQCVPTEQNDYCGVHTNSGIANKAFYMAVTGGLWMGAGYEENGFYSNTSISFDTAEKIWYTAYNYMTSSTNFLGARNATLNAASALYGKFSYEYCTVARAWGMAGVGGKEWLTNGGFEGENNWTRSGTSIIIYGPTSAKSGNYYLGIGGLNSTSGIAYQNFTISDSYATPTPSANLTFWLRGTTTEINPQPYDKLYVELVNPVDDSVIKQLAVYSNLDIAPSYQLKGFSATVTYTINLSAYKGQNVQIRFRATNDASNPTTFFVDDVTVQ